MAYSFPSAPTEGSCDFELTRKGTPPLSRPRSTAFGDNSSCLPEEAAWFEESANSPLPLDTTELAYVIDTAREQVITVRSMISTFPDRYVRRIEENRACLTPRGVQGGFVPAQMVQELRGIQSERWDLRRLVRLCEEVNITYANDCLFALTMLVRAVADHMPPLFGETKFEEVARKAARPYKIAADQLQAWRIIPNRGLHYHIGEYGPVVEE